jgi:class 3 adenylate cyclase/tetratricopeptide (TPR) repeat protein
MPCLACGHESLPEARFCPQCGARLGTADAQSIAVETRGQVMSDLRGEERLVTVVFADMSESVRRTSGLSAEEATVLVNPLLETMVELMVQYGGRIDRFLGDGVLAVFGVPAAHEDDPFRAVRAGIDLRERAVDMGLAVTAGVNTGRVYFGPVGSDLHEELTVMGPVVNLAARFQSAAAAGEIVVGHSTAAHLKAAFDLTPVTLTIKGIAEPVEAFKAERLLDHPDKVRGVEGLRAEMVGRDDELSYLRSTVGNRATVALVGPAGVGKSRLASEFRSYVEAQGGVWLEGRCLLLTETTSYAPFLDLFSRHLTRTDLAGLESSVQGLVESQVLSGARAQEVVPFLAHMLGLSFADDRDLLVLESTPDLRKTLTIDAIVEYLSAWARRTPLTVFLEDVHWADPLSREAITALHTITTGPLTLLLAYRPEISGADLFGTSAETLAELTLGELSKSDSRRMISMLLDISGIPERLESQILDRGQGNPFYVEELIRSLIQTGSIARVDEQWVASAEDIDLDLPQSVEGVVMSRFDRLTHTTRRAAKAASVLDRSFGESLFASLAGSHLVPELGTLVGAGILTIGGSGDYSFVHALTRQAIYSNLLPSQRSELHEHTAQALEQDPAPDVEQVAFHYSHSRNHPKAVEYLLKAGERALAAFTTDTASSHLQAGLARIDSLPEGEQSKWRGRYQARLGELLIRMARHTPARDALEAALEDLEPSPLEEAKIWRLIGQSHRLQGQSGAAEACLDRAEEILSSVDGSAAKREWIQVQKERAFTLYFGGRGRELTALNSRVAPIVEEYGSAAQLADHLYGQVLSSFVDDRYVVSPGTVTMARRALGLAESGADPGRIAEGRFGLGFSLLWADQIEEAAEVLGKAVEETTRVGAVTEGCRAKAYLAIALRRLGLVDEAEQAAMDALRAAEQADSSYYSGHAYAVLCWVAWRRADGTCDEKGEMAYEKWGTHENAGKVGLGTEFAWLAVWPRAATALERGDHVTASENLELLLVPWERPMPEHLRALVSEAMSHPDPVRLAAAMSQAQADSYL